MRRSDDGEDRPVKVAHHAQTEHQANDGGLSAGTYCGRSFWGVTGEHRVIVRGKDSRKLFLQEVLRLYWILFVEEEICTAPGLIYALP